MTSPGDVTAWLWSICAPAATAWSWSPPPTTNTLLPSLILSRTGPCVEPALSAHPGPRAGLALATVLFLRKHYQTPLVTKGSPSYNNPPWVVGQWYTGPNGATVSQQTIRNVMGHAPASVRNSLNPNAATAYLSAHHYTQWSAYQPESRFWHFQLIEGGWLLALSLILLAATVWLVRRRAA
jgi:hypothetical protein